MTDKLPDILKYHLIKYPLLEPQDLYKLLYQQEFGPKHFNLGETKVKNFILEELKICNRNDESIEDIGNGFVRIYLYKSINVDNLTELFINSSKEKYGSNDHFKTLLNKALNLIPSLSFVFSSEQFGAFIKKMERENYPDVHHSEIYRQKYAPHYRVIKVGNLL